MSPEPTKGGTALQQRIMLANAHSASLAYDRATGFRDPGALRPTGGPARPADALLRSLTPNGRGLVRTNAIREFHEAYINTGIQNPPTYAPPASPVTPVEAATFDAFVRRRRTLYACVLPGEIVREAVTNAAQGLLDPVVQLGIKHLIVDEFQDLNPVDVQFVHDLIGAGALAFVCGDDDQSIYSFRHGSPQGMQSFPTHYTGCPTQSGEGHSMRLRNEALVGT
jgi:UvrD/REP helicase N-terminal domain